MIFKNISHLLSFFVIPLKMWGKKKEIFPQKKKKCAANPYFTAIFREFGIFEVKKKT